MSLLRHIVAASGARARAALVCTAVALAAAAAPALAPQAAQASGGFSFQTFYEFTVAFSGQGSYSRTVSSEGGGTLSEEATWKWSTVYPHVLVPTTRSSPLSGASFPAIGLGQEASGQWKITNTGEGEEDCSNSGNRPVAPRFVPPTTARTSGCLSV